MKLGLDAMREALALCGDPHWQHTRVLVAGTNGKGSTSARIHGLLVESGLRCGLFTSPHLVDFAERIRIDGRTIDDERFLRIGPRVLAQFGGTPPDESWKPLLSEEVHPESVQLSYFELATLMAAIGFADAAVDVGIYEVGLGGRLDATNALDADVAVITAIGMDHTQYLGDTLEAIAGEKAGILRSGKPAILGSRVAAATLRAHATEVGAHPTLELGRDYGWRRSQGTQSQSSVVFEVGSFHTEVPCNRPDWDLDNMATALAATQVVAASRGLTPTPDAVRSGLAKVSWPGRIWRVPAEHIQRPVTSTFLMDAAHNPAGAEALRGGFSEVVAPEVPVVLVFACLKDKDAVGIYDQLRQIPNLVETIVVPIDNPRALAAEDLADRIGLPVSASASTLEVGLGRALEVATEAGIVLVSGSIYLLGEVISWLGAQSSLETIL